MSTSSAAPVMNLKGDPGAAAQTLDVYRPVARALVGTARAGVRVAAGTARFAAGYPFYRPWYGYGYYRPYYAWYRPWYGPRVFVNVGFGYPYYAAYSPAYYSYSATYDPAVTYAAPAATVYSGNPPPAAPPVVETAPPPRPNDGYRYDGGPANPVPAPLPMPRPTPPQTPPPPPAADSVARRPAKKLEYPAYGEAAGKVRTVRDPLLVKEGRGQ